MAALTFRYCLLHDLGEPGRRGYSLWLVVHWLKSRLPEVAVILRRHQEGVEMIFPRFHDRAEKFNWRPVAPTIEKALVSFVNPRLFSFSLRPCRRPRSL